MITKTRGSARIENPPRKIWVLESGEWVEAHVIYTHEERKYVVAEFDETRRTVLTMSEKDKTWREN